MTELHFLTKLISAVLYEKSLPTIPSEFDWNKFNKLVLQNGFVSLLYGKIEGIEEMPDNIRLSFEQKNMQNMHRSVLQKYYEEALLNRFEKEKIKCLPLKGIILRKLYPQFYMRAMTDLDILVEPSKIELTRSIMNDLGFDVYRYDTHHDIYYIKPNVNVEIHKMLIVGEMEDYFQIGFERAYLREGSDYIYELSKEDFYIHMLGHMAYHFAHGGVGMRLVLDIKVYLDHYHKQLNRDYLKQELDKVGLYTFANHMERLAYIWFGGDKSSEFYDELGIYIVNSGYLGNEMHKEILEVVKQTGSGMNRGARARAILTKIFLPYEQMAFSYPILKKYSALLPFLWIVRWVQVLRERKRNISQLYKLAQVNDNEIRKLGELYDKLEMRHLL